MELPGSTGPHALEYKAQTVQKPRATWRRISCGRIRTILPTKRKPERDHWGRGLRRWWWCTRCSVQVAAWRHFQRVATRLSR